MIDGHNWLITQNAITIRLEYSIQFYQYINYLNIHIVQVGDC